MNESNIKFLEAVKLFNENFFWDAIELFQDALSDGLEDKFVDDCFLNIAICYMQLNLFNEAQEFFLKAIDSSKIYGDKIDSEGAVYGKTSDRAKLGLIRILLAKNDVESAKESLKLAQPEIMRGVTKGIFHKNNASRKISRLSARIKVISK